MPTGGFIGYAPPVSRSNGNAGANSIFLSKLTALQSGIATAVLLDATATSGISLKAVIYDASHSALLASGSTVTSVAVDYNRLPLTANLNVVAGTAYYVGYACNASCPVTIDGAAVGPGSWWVNGGQSVASPANPLVGGASNTNTLMVALELDGTASPGFGWAPDHASGVTRSVSNTVATFSTATSLAARSIVAGTPGAGKFYAEVDVGGTIASRVGIGVATASVGAAQGMLSNGCYQSLLQDNGITIGTLQNTIGLSYASGDTIGIARDSVANLTWWNKNNGSWFGSSGTAGNPVSGTLGETGVPNKGWPVMIVAADLAGSGTAAVFTLRDTAGALKYTPPSGYAPWSSATFSVVTTQARAWIMA